ncbi:hypothetical protein MKQ70_28080 [Chitinophaga sedimenti]|uniref:hypothetical protein n=1 Tax=Chitinophaga sedimenti TaxID=2033606 RepID=UPI002003F5FE|nr:hypothetical protein [Chitinophaga sedimenti]MCK7558645.1 hypothetical protein [Chitinophaga sedimenti]
MSILLLSLMCIQVLPIKEVGKLLFNNQIVEEHVDSSAENGCNQKCGFKQLKDFYGRNFELSEQFEHALIVSITHYQLFENISSGPIKEIHTPLRTIPL